MPLRTFTSSENQIDAGDNPGMVTRPPSVTAVAIAQGWVLFRWSRSGRLAPGAGTVLARDAEGKVSGLSMFSARRTHVPRRTARLGRAPHPPNLSAPIAETQQILSSSADSLEQ